MSRACKTRIDYRVLNSTGERILRESSGSSSSNSSGCDSDLDESDPDKTLVQSDPLPEDVILSFENLSFNTLNKSLGTSSISNLNQNSIYENIHSNELIETFTKLATHVYGLHKLIKSDTNCPGCQSPNYTKTSTTQKMDISSTDPSLVQRALGQDVDDFIEEYPTDDCEDVNEIDNCISKIEELRSIYRLRHGEYALSIDKYEESLEKKIYDERILAIKKYLFQSKVHRKSLKAKVTNSESKSCIFLINELERMMLELDKELTYEKVYFTDDQITTRKSELPQYERKLDNVSKSVKELISINKGNDVKLDNDIKIITKEYTNLCKKKEKFIDFIKDESESRELSKNELFKESKMKIQLSKFSGHDSKSDFYTFQSDFYKISRSVPKRYAADVLKNNYLEGSALALVKNLEDIDEIWERLREAYGDPKLLLKKKLSEIDSVNDLWKIKNPERVSNSLTKLINVMRDLVKLAADHGIEIKLYGGDGLDRIYRLMGDDRLTKWLISIADKDLSDKKKWTDLIIFLESDLKIQHQKVLINKKRDEKSFEKSSSKDSNYYIEDDNSKESDSSSGYFVEKDDKKCHLCDEEDHFATNGPNGIKLIQYYACRKFTELNPNERFIMLRKKGFCIQCLFPGASQEKGKHSEGKCQRDFICPHPSHEQHAVKKHVLLCHDHRNSKDNQELLVKYKERFINKQNGLPSYSKEIKLSFISSYKTEIAFDDDDKLEEAVFMLQNITVDSQEYSVFYDSGCSSMVCRYDAIQKIGSRAKQKVPGPLVINGVGNAQSISRHGEFQVKLPLFNGKDATLQGLCLDAITHKFPVYPLQGEIESDINQAFNQTKRSGKLPRLPYSVGGSEIDFMIGMKYKRYHPKEIFSLPSGLTILESKFFNPDGSRGIICGPHRLISGIEQSNFSLKAFLTNQYQLFKSGYQINPDVSFLHQNPSVCSFPDENLVFCTSPSNNCGKCTTCKESSNVYTSKKLELFQSAEDAGSEILFRCNECRDCKVCRNHKNVENISIREEVEQQLIDKSIEINIEEGYIEASLPMTHKPSTKLPPSNHDTALRVYNRVVKQLNKSPKDKEDIIRSEAEMQALGFVDYVSNLSEEDRVMLEKSAVKYYIPWLVMWKPNSLSTPCRMVLNGSFPTSTGNSLNDILPKGKKSLNNLVMIIIRWFTYFIAFHTDIRKMYNTIHLKKEYWTFQRYIWQDELDIKKIPIEKVIKTIIYGLCPSGNQSENALRGLTDLKKDEYPEVQRIIHEDTFMDDCISGGSSMEKTTKLAVNLEAVLKCGSFSLKGVTFSGKSPPPKVSCDGKMVNVAGMRWFPEDDLIALDINDLNFSKKRQGKKTLSSEGVIPEKLTRRHCASRTGELFDISGKIAPIIATFKLDLHELAYSYKLKWDDVLPNNLREVWCSHFEMMNEIKDLRFKRAVIPEDAVSERFTTLDFGDASQKIICVAIYARYLRKNGEYSCQLLFARTKIVSPPMSQPRAELFAATVNAHTGEIVKRACSTYHEGHTKITDSQVALCWIHNTNKPLKQYVRNRVVEIRRFTEISNWRYTQSNNMIADIGTRPIKDLSLVDLNSTWQNGHSWMRHDVLPFKSIDEIILTKEDADEVQKEALIHDWISEIVREPVYNSVPSEVTSIYKFSNYLYDPNKYRFEKVVRVMALVIRFVNVVRESIKKKKQYDPNSDPLIISDEEITHAKNYYFRKATLEIKEFSKSKEYERISVEKDGILYYNGRILPTEKIVDAREEMADVMRDLSGATFCVPLVHRNSPLAYSLVNEIHWYSNIAKHRGIETIWRQILKIAYIMNGRILVKKFNVNCARCRYLRKKFIEIAMGPISDQNLVVAPAFYSSQVDIFGPFTAYDPTSKRKSLKIWFVVFCCSTTATVNIRVMEDYSTSSFILAFIRFASEVGYPKKIQVDDGSQLVKGCESMKLSYQDIKFRLHREMSVDFNVCPVGGHNVNGKVERRIRHIKESMERTMNNERLSFIQWETIALQISNCINDLPLALGNIVSDFENADLLTPNRLKLGRNNDRAPVFPIETEQQGNLQKLINLNNRIYRTWFEVWLTSHVPKLVDQPKWFVTDRNMKVGDIVLMLKHEGQIESHYQYGMVHEIERSRDDVIRKVQVKYRNHSENHNRFTWRSVRKLVLIHPVDELSIMEELAQAHCSFIMDRYNLLPLGSVE